MSDTNNIEHKIAIIGVSNRFPHSDTLEQYWKNIVNGIELIDDLNDQELLDAGIDSQKLTNKNYVKRASRIKDIGVFDANFFHMTDKEATLTAPAQRLLLTCAYEAFENAAYSLDTIGENKTGVFVGVNRCTDWQRRLYDLEDQDDSELSNHLQFSIASDLDYAATRISYKLHLEGPSFNVSTACSTSLVAIHQACQSLLNYESDMALAGGANIILSLENGYLYEQGGILSNDGHCRAFDATSNGTVSGNGVGLVLLKRLEEAIDDRDHIYAVICGTAINNDGSDKVGFTAPSVAGQSKVVSAALAIADINPEEVGYIETHGTGTSLGDPIEIEALTKAYRAYTDKQQYCAIGSVKTNMGHLGAAAGVASLLKAVLSLQHKTLPPSLNFSAPNPDIDFERSPFYVNTKAQAWPDSRHSRLAAVSSFGVGGTNAHTILEEAPVQQPSQIHRNTQLLLLSARSESALAAISQGTADVLKNNNDYLLGEIAYSQNIGRQAFEYRHTIAVNNKQDAIEQLSTAYTATKSHQKSQTAYLFSGQGSQYANMAYGVYQSEPVFKAAVDHCADLLAPFLQVDIREFLFPLHFTQSLSKTKQQDRLTQTAITQPALFVIEYAYAKLWQHWGVHADKMIGHSIGEYVAAHLAGVMNLADALLLVAERGRLMQTMEAGAMLSVPMAEAELLPYLTQTNCDLAVVNGPSWCVASGSTAAINTLSQTLSERNITCRPLQTSHAFHSRMMEPILATFKQCVEKVSLSAPTIPFVSNVTGDWINDSQAMDTHYWVEHLRSTVHFYSGIKTLLDDQHTVLIEVGPGQALLSLIASADFDNKSYTAVSSCPQPKQTDDDMTFLLANMGKLWQAGTTIDLNRFYEHEKINRVALPTYPFEGKYYWLDKSNRANSPTQAVVNISKTRHSPENNKENSITLLQQLSSIDSEQRLSILHQFLAKQLSHLLGTNEFDHDTPLVELGMSSLMAIELRTRINHELEAELIDIIDLFDSAATINKLTRKLLAVLSHIADITDSRNPNRQQCNKGNTADKIKVDFSIPLSSLQQRFWFLGQFENIGSTHHMSTEISLRGKVDKKVLQKAFNKVVQRHDMLRVSIQQTEQEVIQIVHHTIDLPYSEIDCESLSSQSDQVRKAITEFSNKSFDFSCAPLFRVGVIRLSDTHFILLCTMHHIISDAWSMTNFWKEVSCFYNADINQQKALLPSISMPYPDYIDWQQSQQQKDSAQITQDYWQQQLKSLPSLLELPADRPRPAQINYQGDQVFFNISSEIQNNLLALCKHEGVTLYMMLLAAFNVLLTRLTNQTDIVVGTPISNRNKDGLRDVVGLFANTLVMRNKVSPTLSFVELLAQVKSTCLEAYQHQNMPFSQLVDFVNPERSQSYSPIYQTLFSLQDTPSDKLDFSGTTIEVLTDKKGTSKIDLIRWNAVSQTDLSLILETTNNGIQGVFEYSVALFDKNTIQRFAQHFETLLMSIIHQPTMEVSQLSILSDKDYHQLIHQWNQTDTILPSEQLIHQNFEKQVDIRPNATAVIFEEQTLTYYSLNQKTNQLAHYLISRGIKPNTIVAIYCDRSLDMIVALLAILKAGATYLPLDPSYPDERLSLMLNDGDPQLVLTQLAYNNQFSNQCYESFCLDGEWENISTLPKCNPVRPMKPDDLAYVIYTSGSTGKPKGVKITHKNVVNLLCSMQRCPGISSEDKLLALTTLCFDISIVELFWPLISGACVEIASRALARDPQALSERIQQSQITLLQATPTTWRMLLDSGWAGSKALKALVGGETLPLDIVARLLDKTGSLWNMYGPTETTVWSSGYQITDPTAPIVIGQAIANTQLYILDNQCQPVPIGVSGELYIGGIGVSLGYLKQKELSKTRFLPNPFNNKLNDKMYRTGDLARWRADGTVECLGRCDDQVKVRGYRIELSEIENALNQSDLIQQSVVALESDNCSSQKLIAYLIPHTKEVLNLEKKLRNILKQSLPDYMLPSQFYITDNIPLTDNGKIDKKQLSALKDAEVIKSEVQLASSDTEKALTVILSDLLAIPQDNMSLNDNFFDIGGHSILLMRFITRLEKAFQIKLPLISVYNQPILSDIALAIDHECLKSSIFVNVASIDQHELLTINTDREECEI